MRLTLIALVLTSGCAASRAAMPTLQPLSLEAPAQVLQENHFSRDRTAVSEGELREILAAPVFLEEHARIGVLPVSTGYAPDGAVPVEAAPATIAEALECSISPRRFLLIGLSPPAPRGCASSAPDIALSTCCSTGTGSKT